jgi:hypothetical protein
LFADNTVDGKTEGFRLPTTKYPTEASVSKALTQDFAGFGDRMSQECGETEGQLLFKRRDVRLDARKKS